MPVGNYLQQTDANNIIQYWFRVSTDYGKSISIDDIINIIILYWRMPFLRFSNKYKSKYGWKLSDDNTMVERILVGKNEREDLKFVKWILADTDPWFDGIHCWRIKIINPNKGWFLIGVSNQDTESMNLWREHRYTLEGYVWGYDACGDYYQKDGIYPEWCPDIEEYIRLEYVEIDVHLNLDKNVPEMKMCAVRDDKPLKEVILLNPKDNDQGWVPYFNMHYGQKDYYGAIGATIRAVFIDPGSYGIPIDNLFP